MESVWEEPSPTVVLPVSSLASLVADVVVELAMSGRAVAEATDDEEAVVEGRTVVKLDVGSTSTQFRS